MNMHDQPFCFLPVAPLKIRLAEDVKVHELVQALTGTMLTVTSHANGGLCIHHVPTGVDRARPRLACDRGPEPPEAA